MIWSGLDIAPAIIEALDSHSASNSDLIFVICSQDTEPLANSLLNDCIPNFPLNHIYVVPNGELGKSLQVYESVLFWLSNNGANRHSVIINIGGGAVCDLGGFVAATFMRGITCWNIPTSLLAMVDASVGGKTGINLGKLKNYIGTFTQPAKVFISPSWLKTLPVSELFSGWAEIVKHGIIEGGVLWQMVQKPMPTSMPYIEQNIDCLDEQWLKILKLNIEIKSKIVESDFREFNSRKLLNMGHTIGHALESLYLENANSKTGVNSITTILCGHGHAVASGLIIESHIAHQLGMCTSEFLAAIKEIIEMHFSMLHFTQIQIPQLIKYILADKKNNQTVLMSLATAPGNCKFNIPVPLETITESLKYYAAD